MKNLLIAFVFALMLINPNISIAAESPVDVQEVFVGSETRMEMLLNTQKEKQK